VLTSCKRVESKKTEGVTANLISIIYEIKPQVKKKKKKKKPSENQSQQLYVN
jgi:hypothetical protein